MPLPAVAGLLSSAMGSGGGASALGGLGSAITGLGSACANAAGLAAQLGKSLLGALTGPLDAVKSLGNAVGSFVEKINPAAVQAFERAVDSTMATIGQLLTPIMQSLTTVAQSLGKAFAAMSPILEPLMDTFAGIIEGFASAMLPVLESMAPFIQVVVEGFSELMLIIAQVGAAVAGFVSELYRQLAELLGLKSDFNKEAQASTAVKKVGTSDVAGFAKLQFDSQLKGLFGGKSEGEKNRETQQAVADALTAGQSAAAELAGAIKELVVWLNSAKSIGSDVKETVKSGISLVPGGDLLLSVL